jgi:hypothetical protein
MAGALVLGALFVGAGAFLIREKATEQPTFTVTLSEGDFELRDYPAMVVAQTSVDGERAGALNRGFRILADYIFAKSRKGEQIAMTAPVLSSRNGQGEWRTRFVMPATFTPETLPAPPKGVSIEERPAYRVAAVRFGGRATDAVLERHEKALRQWLAEKGETETGVAEYAFYNSPFVPGPLRRNEVLIVVG